MVREVEINGHERNATQGFKPRMQKDLLCKPSWTGKEADNKGILGNTHSGERIKSVRAATARQKDHIARNNYSQCLNLGSTAVCAQQLAVTRLVQLHEKRD